MGITCPSYGGNASRARQNVAGPAPQKKDPCWRTERRFSDLRGQGQGFSVILDRTMVTLYYHRPKPPILLKAFFRNLRFTGPGSALRKSKPPISAKLWYNGASRGKNSKNAEETASRFAVSSHLFVATYG
jgi:hypothetical protein